MKCKLEQPSISVIISTYDDRNLVEKKLREIKQQSSFDVVEFIFVETASPGKERELIKPFCEENPNCSLLALDERLNLYAAWNLGWEASSSPYVCISNMDDTMHPDLLSKVIKYMDNSQNDVASVLISKEPLGTNWNDLMLRRLRDCTISLRPGPFFVWKRKLREEIGMFDSGMTVAGDKDFWARAGHVGLKLGLLPELLYLYSKHSNQLSKSTAVESRKAEDMFLAQSKDYPHVWPVQIQKKLRMERFKLKCFGWQLID